MLRLVSECCQACSWSPSGDSEFYLCLLLYLLCLGGPRNGMIRITQFKGQLYKS